MKSQKQTKWKANIETYANVKIKEIITSINVIVDDEKNEWKDDTINDIWEKWARKTDTKRRCATSIFVDIALFVESQYIKILK